MVREGRGRTIVGWAVLGALCLTSLGCHLSVDTGVQKQTPPTGTDSQAPPILLPTPSNRGPEVPGGDSALKQASYMPERVQPGEPVSMPTRADGTTALASGPVTADRAMPHEMTAADVAAGLPPGLAQTYGEGPHGGAFMHDDYNKVPTEKQKVTHPPYIVEPPDILIINAARLVPRPPYIIQPLDLLSIEATGTFPGQPIAGQFIVGPDGFVTLGFRYGRVKVSGLKLEEAQEAVRQALLKVLAAEATQVRLGLLAFQTAQEVQGFHLVRQDGTISLGVYGCVYITGMTMCQAQTVIEQHLSQFFQDPEISLDVYSYNSKAYYVIFDGGGYGQTVLKFPITGNETVLDAIYNAGGLPSQSSRRRMWVARPAPANHECVQILPVDWLAIVQGGSTRTNYQLFPGDRIYVRADPLIQLDNFLAKVISPIERVFGIILLGSSVVRSLSSSNNGRGNNNNNNSSSAFFFTGF